MLWIIVPIAFLVIVLILAYPRLTVARRPNIEGIINTEAVNAYDRVSWGPQYYLVQPLLVRELKKHHPAGILVNLGCGPGYQDAVTARELPQLQVTGLDIDSAMVKLARRNLSARGLADRVGFVVGNVRRLPFKDDTVDFVTSTFSLHHWADAREAMQEIHRVLKPGGQFLLLDLRRDSRRGFVWLVQLAQALFVPQSLRQVDSPVDSIFAACTPQEMDAILAQTAFKKWQIKGSAGWMVVWGQK